VLTEQNREVSMAAGRALHFGEQTLSLGLSRADQVRKLLEIAALRRALSEQVDVEELWTLLEAEERGYTARELAEFVFPGAITDNHVSAVLHVMLGDRLFFKYKAGEFYTRSAEQVEQLRVEKERLVEQEAQLQQGAQWLRGVWQRSSVGEAPPCRDQIVEALKSYCLFGQDSPDHVFTKELLKRANIPPGQSAFRLLVRLGVWQEDENLYLHQFGIGQDFPETVLELAAERVHQTPELLRQVDGRRDLRQLKIITIDSALTRDYDDALSLRPLSEGLYELGVHISDAAAYVCQGDALDEEALERATSIYLPDCRIPMLPTALSEGACSLRAGEDRLALSFLMRMDADAIIHGCEIVSSVVTVHAQMTYHEVNQQLEHQEFLHTLHQLSQKLRSQRVERGAIILPVPEIRVWVNPEGMIQVSRYEKEAPSQIIVSELMILANQMAAGYLAEHNLAAIFRSQEECRPETNPVASEYELFHVYRQRRLFARAALGTQPKPHCSVGVPHYTSVTSPIRRYVDLIVQRQLKQALETGAPLYDEKQLEGLITRVEVPQSKIMIMRRKWERYWILKYLEQEDIKVLDALVLDQNNRFAHLLLPDFIMETNLPVEEKGKTRPGEMVRIKIEHLNPREDILRVKLLKP
jgi:exoribonuclease II